MTYEIGQRVRFASQGQLVEGYVLTEPIEFLHMIGDYRQVSDPMGMKIFRTINTELLIPVAGDYLPEDKCQTAVLRSNFDGSDKTSYDKLYAKPIVLVSHDMQIIAEYASVYEAAKVWAMRPEAIIRRCEHMIKKESIIVSFGTRGRFLWKEDFNNVGNSNNTNS